MGKTLPFVLLVPMSREEWADLRALVDQPHVRERCRLGVFSPHRIFAGDPFVEDSWNGPVWNGVNPTGIGFYDGGKLNKSLLTLLNAAFLVVLCLRHGVRLLASGVPSAYVRLGGWCLPSVRHVAYLRSAYPTVNEFWSDSERWMSRLGRMHLRLPSFLRTYQADDILLSGFATRSSLERRGINLSRTVVIGPAALAAMRSEEAPNSRGGAVDIAFVTQAFLRHADAMGHEAQLRAVEEMVALLHDSPTPKHLVIRKHPHERGEHYRHLLQDTERLTVVLDERTPSEFLSSAREGGVLVGATSTLLFEWAYLGGRSYSFATDAFREKYAVFFDQLGIEPYERMSELLDHVSRGIGGITREQVNGVLALPDKVELDAFGEDFSSWLLGSCAP